MDITPLVQSDSRIIQGYGPGSFRISGQLYEHPVIVFPDRVARWDIRGAGGDLTVQDFAVFFEQAEGVDVALLGCGRQGRFLDPDVRQAFAGQGILPESMDSGAACRTYNVLMAEGRRVAALLLPV